MERPKETFSAELGAAWPAAVFLWPLKLDSTDLLETPPARTFIVELLARSSREPLLAL